MEENIITADDIRHVLEEYSLRVNNTQGKSFETMAEELLGELDFAAVVEAAAKCETKEARDQAVFDALHELFVEESVLEF